MKTVKFSFLLLFATLLLSSCGPSLQLTTDFDRTIDFSKYKSFGIYNLAIEAQTISDLNRTRIHNAIRAAMKARGLSESTTPDIWVNALAVVDTREQHSSTTMTTGMGMGMGMGMGGFHRPYGWGMMGGPMMMTGTSVAHTTHNVDIYHKGSLIIDIIDGRTHNLVWHATGRRKIDKKFRREADTKIMKYVEQMLTDFPPETIVRTNTKVMD